VYCCSYCGGLREPVVQRLQSLDNAGDEVPNRGQFGDANLQIAAWAPSVGAVGLEIQISKKLLVRRATVRPWPGQLLRRPDGARPKVWG
jgi:hypothetical protein